MNQPTASNQSTQKPDHTYLVLSYDVITIDNSQKEFRDAMISKQWNFQSGGKNLPASTCMTSYGSRVVISKATAEAKKNISDAETEVRKKIPKFKVERFVLTVFHLKDSDYIFESTTTP
jgi:hypothetical protein